MGNNRKSAEKHKVIAQRFTHQFRARSMLGSRVLKLVLWPRRIAVKCHMSRILILALILISSPIAPAFCQDLIEVQIDRRFELMSIVFRLADFSEFRMGNVSDYNEAVDTFFSPFKEHAAVRMARELRRSVAFDAIPNLAVRATDAVSFKPLRSLKDPSTHLDSRWKPEVAAEFLKAMASFAKDTKADQFFKAQEPLYRLTLDSCREGLLSHLDQGWFERTFGTRDRDSFTLCIALLNGPGNYGASAANNKGGEDLFALIGTGETPRGKSPSFSQAYLGTLVHEFLHSFVNPWVDRHLQDLKAAGEALNAPVIEQMKRQAYGPAYAALRESMVRALTIRYFRDVGQDSEAGSQEAEQDKRGFYWVKDLAELLGDYTRNRAQYSDLEAFSPKLVTAFKMWGSEAPKRFAAWQEARQARLDALYAKGPKLVSMEPANGAQDVDPAIAIIQFVFDRPMKSGTALMRSGGTFPEKAGNPTWDVEGRVLSFPVHLKPGTTYRFGLNAEDMYGFQDRDGSPLQPIIVSFRTR